MLKTNKATGTDEIPNEIIRILLDDALGLGLVLRLLNFCWTTATAPALWQVAHVVAIFKNKGSAQLPTNYRPISLIRTFQKLFTLLIDRRLRSLEDRVWQMQMGFRRGRSTDDANFLLLRLQELCSRWQDFPLFILMLDWVKCYDRIHHGPLLDALRRFGLPPHYLKVIQAIYTDLKCFVRDA